MRVDDRLLDAREKAALCLRGLYAAAGYRRFRMSRFEPYDLYAGNKDFLVSQSVLTFTEPGGRLMALRPDVTLSIVKAFRPGETRKLQYNENVYRPRPGDGEYREIMQAGIECLGDIGLEDCREVLLLAAGSLKALGEEFALTLSHQGLIDRALSGISAPGLRRELLDCLNARNIHGLRRTVQAAGLRTEAGEALALLMGASGLPRDVFPRLEAGGFEGGALDELCSVCQALELAGYGESLRLDFSIGADSRYYGGILFKGFLRGLPESILAGGRYDPLMRRMGHSAGGIGFAVYLDRLDDLPGGEEVHD